MTEIVQLSTATHKADAPIPSPPGAVRTDGVYIVFTTVEATVAAAHVAAAFADALAVPLTLVHFRVVPYPLEVDAPVGISPVETNAFADHLKAEGINVHVRVFLCRHSDRALPMAFKPHSLVVIGGRRSWLPTQAERWRRRLETAGHLVVFVDETMRRGRGEKTHA